MPDGYTNNNNLTRFMSHDEIIFLANYFCHRGVNKIRLTGGEPTMRPDLINIISWLFVANLYLGY